MSADAYSFRPATRDDLTLLRAWLRTPEVQRWWGDPAKQKALLHDDIEEPDISMWMVLHEGRPFAYAQHYHVQAWPQPHFARLPHDACAIDAFIGEPNMIGKGHGSAFLRQLALRLRDDGAETIAIDPNADNVRARSAYRNAGFRGQCVVETKNGPAVLMLFKGEASD